ncbi:hypothetical protein ACOI9H_01680 [Corynebacterium striatum]|uniref:hypothetical protein n=1 Tax=Corynebacterium striatum TaxID=43770 RepID=UPI003B5B1ECF
MAGKSAVLSVRIIADAAKAAAGFGEAEKQVGGFSSKMEKIGGVADKAAGMATVASGAYVAFAAQTVEAASEMEQSVGAVNAVFGEQADVVMKSAEAAAQSVGLSSAEYANMAALMGSQLQNMGIESDQVAGKTEELISLGADMAAMYGGTTADAVSAISSLLRGERDPIERYAVGIKQADINARLAADGLSGLEGEAARQAETQATLSLLFEQSGNALGTFSRESETVAGQQQRATAEWQNAKAALGEQLLPYVTKGAEMLGGLARAIGEHPELFKAAGVAILTFTAAFQGISIGIKTVQMAKVAFTALNTVISANPMGAFITVVGLVVGALITAYQNSETFREAVHKAGQWAADAFAGVVDWVKGVWAWIQDLIDSIGNLIGWLRDAWNWAVDVVNAVGDALSFSGSGPEMTMQIHASNLLTMAAAAPEVTAAATVPPGSFARTLPTPATAAPTVYNISVNGVLDGDAAARKIKDLLEKHDRRQGW